MKALRTFFLSAFLVLALLAGPAAAGAADASAGSGPEGVWKLTGMTSDGKTTTKEELALYEDLGMVMYMELRKDGTAHVSGFGEDISGTWDDKAVTMSGTPIPWTLEKDVLTLKSQEDSMTYERTTLDAIYAILGYKDGVLDENVKYSDKEQTLLDTEHATVKITGYKADKSGFSVSLQCENKTDHWILISAENVYLNKYVFKPTWAMSLEAAETRTTDLICSPDDLERSGISAVDELTLGLKVTDTGTWETLTATEIVSAYPTDKKPEEIKVAERTPAEKETVILDTDDYVFILLDDAEDPILGYTINCYYENKTDRILTFTWGSATVNGEKAVALYAEETLPGTRGYTRVILMDNDEEDETEKKEVKEVSSELRIFDRSGDTPQTVATEKIVYKP